MTSLPINLPNGFMPRIKTGDNIVVGQVIASKNLEDSQVINIPQALNIKITRAKKVLIKAPGEEISKGDVIAIKSNLFGTKKTILKSNVEGTIIRYERNSGNLVVKTGRINSEEDIVSPIDGIIGMCDNDKILINTDRNFLSGSKSVGSETAGEIFFLEVDDMYRIDSGAIGKIIVGHNLNREILLKGIGIGSVGLIGTAINDEDIEHIREKNFTTPIIEIDEESIKRIMTGNVKKIFMDAKTKTVIFLSL